MKNLDCNQIKKIYQLRNYRRRKIIYIYFKYKIFKKNLQLKMH